MKSFLKNYTKHVGWLFYLCCIIDIPSLSGSSWRFTLLFVPTSVLFLWAHDFFIKEDIKT